MPILRGQMSRSPLLIPMGLCLRMVRAALTTMSLGHSARHRGFFDVVTYTGTGSAQNISHNLGSVPGCIIIKNRSNTADWTVYHRGVDASSPEDYNLALNKTDARDDNVAYFNDTAPTSTVFTVNSDSITLSLIHISEPTRPY